VEIGAYDIARVLSVPGTWRPPHNKPNDAPYLHDGFLRRWLPPYHSTRPERREVERLAVLIVEAAALRAEQVARTSYRLPTGLSAGGRPGDAYNAAMSGHDVARLLTCHGWTIEDDTHADKIVLSRPGKGGGTSATIRSDKGVPIFYSFSDNCAPFEPQRGYAPFGVYLTLEHGGDARAAGQALAQQGYGTPPRIVLPGGRTARRHAPLTLPQPIARPPLTLPTMTEPDRTERRLDRE
jgi:hypothetical protein